MESKTSKSIRNSFQCVEKIVELVSIPLRVRMQLCTDYHCKVSRLGCGSTRWFGFYAREDLSWVKQRVISWIRGIQVIFHPHTK